MNDCYSISIDFYQLDEQSVGFSLNWTLGDGRCIDDVLCHSIVLRENADKVHYANFFVF